MRALIVMAALLLLSAEPSWAAPVQGEVGVVYKPLNPQIVGFDAEIGPSASPWAVGLLYQAMVWEQSTGDPTSGYRMTHRTSSAWGRYRFTLPNGDTLDGLAGMNANFEFNQPDNILQPESPVIGPLLGASYTLRSGRLWLRLTPHWVFSEDHTNTDRIAVVLDKSGIPWAEVGLNLPLGLQLSFRLSEAFAKLAWTFD